MTDLVSLILRAGDGGLGKVSFHREKYVLKGGPDGGAGGQGGNVVVRGTRSVATLKPYAGKTKFEAQAGEPGGRRKDMEAKARTWFWKCRSAPKFGQSPRTKPPANGG